MGDYISLYLYNYSYFLPVNDRYVTFTFMILGGERMIFVDYGGHILFHHP
jgi:hypothetical protein